jgi:hypothetical protein
VLRRCHKGKEGRERGREREGERQTHTERERGGERESFACSLNLF